MDVIVGVRCKAFSSETSARVHRCMVEADGTVRVWDAVAGYYTTTHALTGRQMGQIRRKARAATVHGIRNCALYPRRSGGDYRWYASRDERDEALAALRARGAEAGLDTLALSAGISAVYASFGDVVGEPLSGRGASVVAA